MLLITLLHTLKKIKIATGKANVKFGVYWHHERISITTFLEARIILTLDDIIDTIIRILLDHVWKDHVRVLCFAVWWVYGVFSNYWTLLI